MILDPHSLAKLSKDGTAQQLAHDLKVAWKSCSSARAFFGRQDPNYERSFNAEMHRARLIRFAETLVSWLMNMVGYEFGVDHPTIALKSQVEFVPATDVERNYAAAFKVLGCDFLVVKELVPTYHPPPAEETRKEQVS
jgi:hypothetical protein